MDSFVRFYNESNSPIEYTRHLGNPLYFYNYSLNSNDNVDVVYNKLRKENNFELDVDMFIALAKKERPDTVVLINPNNPNGGYLDFETIQHLLRELRDVKSFILDESFIHFAYENEYYDLKTASNLVYKFPNLILVNTPARPHV